MADQAAEIFTQEANQQTAAPTESVQTQEPSHDPFVDLLSGITNEDGTQKYPDVATALTSMPHAQTHISNLEKDNKTLKDELANAKAAEELLRKSVGKETPAQTPFSQEQLAALVSSAIDQKTTAGVKATNLESVGKVFSDTYGDKAKSELQAVADANGVDMAFIKNLAETSPRAALKLAGLSDKTSGPLNKSTSSVNTATLTGDPNKHQPKSVMGAASTADVVGAWRAIGDKVRNQST